MSEALIQFNHIQMSYENHTLFTNLNLHIQTGEKWVLYGKSGSGKSTLLQLLLGFKMPQQGQILFKNQAITAHDIWFIRQQMGYVDQAAQIGSGTVKQQFNNMANLKANKILQLTTKPLLTAFEQFNLTPSIYHKPIDELSGGERQRVALAFALCLQRNIYLLDEVTASLDNELKNTVAQFFCNSPQTCIITSHDPAWLKQPAVKVYDVSRTQPLSPQQVQELINE